MKETKSKLFNLKDKVKLVPEQLIPHMSKDDMQWHRTFNNESTKNTVNIVSVVLIIMTSFSMCSIVLVGVIYWLLKLLLGV